MKAEVLAKVAYLRDSIPAFIRVTGVDRHDVNMLNEIVIEPGAYYVMDRGYLDLFRLHRIHLSGAFFVTRALSDQRVRRLYSRPTDKPSCIIVDQKSACRRPSGCVHRPEPVPASAAPHRARHGR